MDLKHSHQRKIIIKCSAGTLLVSAYCYSSFSVMIGL